MLADLPPADSDQLRADLARVDPQQLARHWPRDARGRLAAKTTALLVAYGPPVTANQRQPCLLISSGGTEMEWLWVWIASIGTPAAMRPMTGREVK